MDAWEGEHCVQRPACSCLPPPPQRASPAPLALSPTAQASIKYRLHILYETLAQYPGDAVLPVLPQLTQLVDRVMAVPLYGVQSSGGALLAAVCQVLAREFPWINGPAGPGPLGPRGVELWVDKEGEAFEPIRWQDATPAQLEAAEKLVRTYLVGACGELRALCGGPAPAGAAAEGGGSGAAPASGGSHAHRMRLTSALLRIWGVLCGLNSQLRDFELGRSRDPAAAASPALAADAGGAVCVVGSKGRVMADPGCR
jgi:hypothetical protein